MINGKDFYLLTLTFHSLTSELVDDLQWHGPR